MLKLDSEEKIDIEDIEKDNIKKNKFQNIFGNKENKISKSLKSRHITFIALGGTIGTGIFLSIGEGIAYSGPAGALVSYIIVGIFVYAVIICLGEMTAYIPSSGAFSHYGSRFVDDAFGFALGINYFLQWAFSIPSELVSAAIIIQYWLPNVQSWIWAIIIIIPMFIIQLINVKTYGETEFWFALIKVIFIILFIIVGLLYDWGAISTSNKVSPGLDNWKNNQAWINGFSTWFQTIVFAFYSYGGTELVALTSGETEKPYKTIPRAIKTTVFRILIFMILTCFVVGLCINHNDDRLLNAYFENDVAQSPITIIFEDAGFGAAKHVVNAILLTAVLSATNSCFFASSRMLMNMSREGKFFPIFGYVNNRGIPIYSLIFTFCISCLVFLTTIWGNSVVFTWFMNITGASAILTWMSIGLISIRFRMALKAQNRYISDLPFKQPLYPLLPITIIILGLFLFIGMGYSSTQWEPFSWTNVFGTYLGVGVFIGTYIFWKVYKWNDVKFIKSSEADLDTGVVWPHGEGLAFMKYEKEMKMKKLEKKSVNWYGKLKYRTHNITTKINI
jgi:amino acid permease